MLERLKWSTRVPEEVKRAIKNSRRKIYYGKFWRYFEVVIFSSERYRICRFIIVAARNKFGEQRKVLDIRFLSCKCHYHVP